MNPGHPPAGLFRGVNIMTPTWLAYFRVQGGWVELSHGRGIEDEPIFGVTFRDASGADPERKSKLVYTRAQAQSYIESLGT